MSDYRADDVLTPLRLTLRAPKSVMALESAARLFGLFRLPLPSASSRAGSSVAEIVCDSADWTWETQTRQWTDEHGDAQEEEVRVDLTFSGWDSQRARERAERFADLLTSLRIPADLTLIEPSEEGSSRSVWRSRERADRFSVSREDLSEMPTSWEDMATLMGSFSSIEEAREWASQWVEEPLERACSQFESSTSSDHLEAISRALSLYRSVSFGGSSVADLFREHPADHWRSPLMELCASRQLRFSTLLSSTRALIKQPQLSDSSLALLLEGCCESLLLEPRFLPRSALDLLELHDQIALSHPGAAALCRSAFARLFERPFSELPAHSRSRDELKPEQMALLEARALGFLAKKPTSSSGSALRV